MQHPLILALDIGSSSVRTLLYGGAGRALPVAKARRTREFAHDGDGTATDDPVALLAAVEACIDETLAQAGSLAAQIVAVAVDTYAGSLLGVDENGRPLTPIYTYADARCAADADALRDDLDEGAVWERTGCPLGSAYTPARLRWLARTDPALWARVACWMPIGAYLEQVLFGSPRVGYSAASWDGLLDRRHLLWDAPLLAHLRLRATQLPPLVDSSVARHGLRQPYATRWPPLATVPFFPALGDGAAANIGSGCIRPGQLAVTIGTTGALRMVLPEVAAVPRGLWCYRVDGRRALLGGATSEGGNMFAWLRETLALPNGNDELEQAVAALAPDSHGLTVLPFVAGERSPGYAGNVRATISGIGAQTSGAELVRAGLEAVAYRFGLIAELLAGAAPPIEAVIASGGALLASPTWCQIVADVLGREVRLSAEPEATSRGAALLAFEALGLARIDELPAALGAIFHPDEGRHTIYGVAMQRQQALYARLIDNL